MQRETLIYGRRDGEQEWQESLLYAGGLTLTDAQIEKVKAAASANGFTVFRVTSYGGEAPRFGANVLSR